MEITVMTTIYVDLDDLIEDEKLKKGDSREKIRTCVNDYVAGFDDAEYYALHGYITTIVDEVEKKLKNEPTTEDWEDFWRGK